MAASAMKEIPPLAEQDFGVASDVSCGAGHVLSVTSLRQRLTVTVRAPLCSYEPVIM